MDNEQLREALEQMHAELSRLDEIGDRAGDGAGGELDPATRDALAQVAEDLKRLLDPDDATTAGDVGASSDGVRGYLHEFEAEHPRLAEAIGRLADGLANLGI